MTEESEKLSRVGTLAQEGRTIAQACNEAGITLATYYRWRRARKRLSDDSEAQVRDLEIENARLRDLVADLSIEAALLRGKLNSPS